MQFLELQFKSYSDITTIQKSVYSITQYTELPMALFQDLLEKNEIGSPLTHELRVPSNILYSTDILEQVQFQCTQISC
jgi:hypothetical protein